MKISASTLAFIAAIGVSASLNAQTTEGVAGVTLACPGYRIFHAPGDFANACVLFQRRVITEDGRVYYHLRTRVLIMKVPATADVAKWVERLRKKIPRLGYACRAEDGFYVAEFRVGSATPCGGASDGASPDKGELVIEDIEAGDGTNGPILLARYNRLNLRLTLTK